MIDGARVEAPPEVRDLARDAYREMCARQSNAWKGEQKNQEQLPATVDGTVSQDPRRAADDAYRAMCAAIGDAWRTC